MEDFSEFDEERYLIEIYADKGNTGISVNENFGSLYSEEEYLLPRNQRYEVIDVDHENKKAKIHLLQ